MLSERRYDPTPDPTLPELRVSRRLRLRLWLRHRKLHAQLKNRLALQGEGGDEMRCVHCGRGWRLVAPSGGVSYLIDLPRS